MADDVDNLAGRDGDGSQPVDARAMLAEWANEQDDWVREAAAQVLSSNRELSDAQQDQIVERFLIEKGFEERSEGLQASPKLARVQQSRLLSRFALLIVSSKGLGWCRTCPPGVIWRQLCWLPASVPCHPCAQRRRSLAW
ncbi:hypothetical protein GCM10027055_26320 [Janibacter alkaliphilus]|uniref:Uncharacterized protein n=1 Tax=Janibacter alkaliphilus TaxID=1069963 RepID=A0A852X3M4_9MICO|nr:hypothetical protein [Janibacter alkaliphilus]NYG37972.1 hypothetical protein [Janibacter alkaliphilus]